MTPQRERATRFLNHLDALPEEERAAFALLVIQWREPGAVTPDRGAGTESSSLRDAVDKIVG